MRTRLCCSVLLPPCMGVRIAQAYRRNGPTMFVAGGVCVPGMFLYVGTVRQQNSPYFCVFKYATLYRFLYWFWEKNRLFCSLRYSLPCSTGDHIASWTGVIFLVFRANELRSGRGARNTFPRRACMSGSSRSLCPFLFACLKNAKK